MKFLAKKPTRGCCSKGPCSKNAINFCCWHLWIFTRTEIWRRLVWLIYTYVSNSLLLFTVLRIRNRAIHKWCHHFLGLYWTSRLVWKSGKLSKSGLSKNRTFSFPNAKLQKTSKNRRKKKYIEKFSKVFFRNFFLFIYFWPKICV